MSNVTRDGNLIVRKVTIVDSEWNPRVEIDETGISVLTATGAPVLGWHVSPDGNVSGEPFDTVLGRLDRLIDMVDALTDQAASAVEQAGK